MAADWVDHRVLPTIECRAIVGVQRRHSPLTGVVVTLCHRWRYHLGECDAHPRHSMIRSYYGINRQHFPNLSRPRALWSAWRCHRMTKDHR